MRSLDRVKDLDFMVVGTGRSGSWWISEVFSGLGIPCGHEGVFGMHPSERVDLRGDSNHESAPHLREIREIHPNIVIFHQLRDPVDYVRSICSEKWFPDPSAHEWNMLKYVDVDRSDPVKAAMQMWIGWNHLISPYANLQYKVEEVTPLFFNVLLGMIRESRGPDEIERAMANAKRNVHVRERKVSDEEIFGNLYYETLRREAYGFGYN